MYYVNIDIFYELFRLINTWILTDVLCIVRIDQEV